MLEKRGKTLNEVEPVENVISNLQSFLVISPVEKAVPQMFTLSVSP